MKGACAVVILMGVVYATLALAEQRFPPPDFESGYTQPILTFQEHRTGVRQYVDVVLLAVALGLAAWLLHKKRSRPGMFVLGIACLLYFGFYKNGCICPIGSIQNITLGVVDSSYPVSLPTVGVFMLPLIFALLYGRVFCGAVCPLGAIQDLFVFRAIKVPRWLEGPLGLLRFFYLGLAVFFVVVYGRFVICEYDPFVAFFRMSGQWWKLTLGAAFLLVGLVIARPYCRYLCPYGALLSVFSRWTSVEVRITPEECNNCTLCDAVCPFGAIDRVSEPSPATSRMRWGLLLLALFVTIGLAAVGYYALGRSAGGFFLGLWFGVVIASKLVGLVNTRGRKTYEADQAACMSCGRCYEWCPHERMRWGTEEREAAE